VIVPCIPEWYVQWYANVPAWLKVTPELVEFAGMFPVSKLASSAVAVWATLSLFFQVTVVPLETVKGLGL
jgi:hypothetical protein